MRGIPSLSPSREGRKRKRKGIIEERPSLNPSHEGREIKRKGFIR